MLNENNVKSLCFVFIIFHTFLLRKLNERKKKKITYIFFFFFCHQSRCLFHFTVHFSVLCVEPIWFSAQIHLKKKESVAEPVKLPLAIKFDCNELGNGHSHSHTIRNHCVTAVATATTASAAPQCNFTYTVRWIVLRLRFIFLFFFHCCCRSLLSALLLLLLLYRLFMSETNRVGSVGKHTDKRENQSSTRSQILFCILKCQRLF